ncbi:MAG: FtsX-like permease family protein [Blastocatellia bacterium]|nr:FtsX-like permease family protein [Blastocatellia bacterium]
MDSLVFSNIRQRPTRTMISMAGVALGVILVLLNTGLVRGMLNDRVRRQQGIGAEIEFTRKGSSTLSPSSIMPLDTRYSERLREIAGVSIVSPVGFHVQKGNTGLGFELVEGIEYESYSAISGLRVLRGRVFQADDEVIIDEFKALHNRLDVGSEIDVFGKRLKVVGVYGPQVGSRIKISLGALQNYLDAPNKCFSIMVKVDDPEKQVEVQNRIDAKLPGNLVALRRDLMVGMGSSIPGLQGFVRAVLALSVVVSTLVILLAMYTTITERTREIGILKSLGASKSFIIGVIEREALAISLIGVVVGLLVAGGAAVALERLTTLQIEFHWSWVLTAALIGLGAGALGALYPAVRAANQDAVKALAYE